MIDPSRPYFAISSDIDWASEDCILDFLDIISGNEIRPTLFSTHKSDIINSYQSRDLVDVGLHPNFLPGSTHGSTFTEVAQHVHDLHPGAISFRSHAYMDGTPISLAMRAHGMLYDSNLSLYLQAGIMPLEHWSGIRRFPSFWCEDVHWTRTGGNWSFNDCADAFFTPGLKIINVHPIHVALNTPIGSFYSDISIKAPDLTKVDVQNIRFQGRGTRTFLQDMIASVKGAGHSFYTLRELYELDQKTNGVI
ncbi:hypothetical protein [Methylobacterium sp. J-070]|uniref:polysaccharide deacetylase WbmS family protein n=1 Tax=Methylobacterium sp. J-070 TaxID=2836650 RepID=UPI001FB952F0|nr:hypothetical protein [Methylobacterium sp. J-070]MCJ2054917.1 hypothetical protein [Methylobacterium sp. J-070]